MQRNATILQKTWKMSCKVLEGICMVKCAITMLLVHSIMKRVSV